MTIITAKVIEDSVGIPYGYPFEKHHAPRLTTFELTYPRFIHPELLTHRVFSRNASSSRAIPVEKMIQMVIDHPAMPIHWGKNQKGMQAFEEQFVPVEIRDTETDIGITLCDNGEEAWLWGRDRAVEVARGYARSGYHKQLANRVLEPYAHITVVVTSTYFDNWFALRAHPAAQPEIKQLALRMLEAYKASTPKMLNEFEWHLPYIDDQDVCNQKDVTALTGNVGLIGTGWESTIVGRNLAKISSARCARTSYLTHDGARPSVEADMALYERLVGRESMDAITAEPVHASPTEHQAYVTYTEEEAGLNGNFAPGWVQHRKLIPNENLQGKYNYND